MGEATFLSHPSKQGKEHLCLTLLWLSCLFSKIPYRRIENQWSQHVKLGEAAKISQTRERESSSLLYDILLNKYS